MQYFPDLPISRVATTGTISALPLLLLIVALLYSAASAPWGQQVDPEATYAMNGIAWATDGLMRKNDHPGTMTILLVGSVVKAGAFLARSDVVEFGLKNFDFLVYVLRAIEALILAGVLLAGGIIVKRATGSIVAGVLFQIGPFAHPELLYWDMLLAPESLMVSCAILGMAFVLKAALDQQPPPLWLGAAQGLTLALGVSAKYLSAPFAILGVSLFRSPWAFGLACVVACGVFFALNHFLNPLVFSLGWRWLLDLATHKGLYGTGEAGFLDLNMFWANMAALITGAPIVSAVFAIGAFAALLRMVRTRQFFDPISLTLLASSGAFSAQLIATSKHFAPHYMAGAWALTGGVLVLTAIESGRLWASLPARHIATSAALIAGIIVIPSLGQAWQQASVLAKEDSRAAMMSKAIALAGPSCANITSMFTRTPQAEINFGGTTSLNNFAVERRFSEAYERTSKVPILDHDTYLTGLFYWNFRPSTYVQVMLGYPCVIVRPFRRLDESNSMGLFVFDPEYCTVAGVNLYTIGIPCSKIREAYEALSQKS